MITIREERMSEAFLKLHLDGLPRAAVLHHFTGPDIGDPHDHPFGFDTFIISGGYIEERYEPGQDIYRIARLPGTSHHVNATDIHRIVSLPHGECWTMIIPGPHEQTSGFWRFDDGEPRWRAWHEERT